MPAVREQGAGRLVPLPSAGRVHEGSRRVRFGDVDPTGRCRLDALACYLQDLSSDDTSDAGFGDDPWWVVRRIAVEVREPATFRELLTTRTFCSGMGVRWAERRVVLTGDRGARIDAATLWVRLDPGSGRPAPLDDRFREVYGPAASGREVTARLDHDAEPGPDARRNPWATRATDLDPLGHVNNAVSWAMVEQALADRPDLARSMRGELEYRAPVEGDDEVQLAVVDRDGGFDLWVVDTAGQRPLLTSRVRPLA